MKEDYSEIDVQETKDGEIFLLHDDGLKRIAGIKRNIWEINSNELTELDAVK